MMHEVASPLEMILAAIGMGFWILFPIAMFLSVSHVDKNTDQIIQLEHHRHRPVVHVEHPQKKKPRTRPDHRFPPGQPHRPRGGDKWVHP